jgi:hypothetical protein
MLPAQHPPVVTAGLSMHVKVTLTYVDVDLPTAAAHKPWRFCHTAEHMLRQSPCTIEVLNLSNAGVNTHIKLAHTVNDWMLHS